jgi:hypothetical protein
MPDITRGRIAALCIAATEHSSHNRINAPLIPVKAHAALHQEFKINPIISQPTSSPRTRQRDAVNQQYRVGVDAALFR